MGLPSYARSEDQTYLTLPEWYIVYSADEYAAFIAHQRPSRFPYFRAVGQFWQSYYDVCAVTRDHYAFNGGYHLSLAVIGTSFTIENILKGLYENTVGRLAEWLSSPVLTEEDAYARAVAVEYGGFLHTVPWYEFPFGAKLGGLWRDTPFFGHNIIRKAERKGALSVEYGTKAGYGWAIRQATQGVYAAEDLQINAWVEGLTPELMAQEPDVRIVRPIDGQAAIIALPRYEAFTQIVPRLSRHGVRFVEIAGNDEILVTLIAPQAWAYDLRAGQALFAMPILTQPEHKRVAIKVPVALLHRVLNDLADGPITLEHIYDY
ncbi:MAG: hypothetical protein CYG59_10380 [Chloroflexi bacterium]|nr:MAG: hypothetical protein CYG59_10380 [Chloroflexota bacterium]